MPIPRPTPRIAFALVLTACVAVSVLPLWVGRHLPAVDHPQHLFLIHVLGHLDETALPYPEIYQARPGLTYLTFYYTVRALASAVGEETALKLWLTLTLSAIPFALWALLAALGRNRWLALLACPLLFTDSFYWGLVSFQSSLALTILLMAAFVRALEAPAGTRASRVALLGAGTSVLLLQLTHGAGMIFPALALPLLLATTPSDWPRRFKAVGALVPGVAVFLLWAFKGVESGRQFGAPGEAWKASAPLFSRENFVFHPIGDRIGKFVELLSNGFWGYADRPATWGAIALAAVAVGLALWRRPEPQPAGALVARARPALLFALAAAYFLLLPSDINGYMYYIYPRYAQLAALLAIPVLALPEGIPARAWAGAAAALAVYSGVNLAVLFDRFDDEAAQFEAAIEPVAPRSRIMHLVLDWSSREAVHAVYLHYAALAALRTDGVPSFSLATDPSFPVGYKPGAQPPASPWEWRPTQFTWEQARWYDYYLVRGDVPPQALFGPHAGEVEQVSKVEKWRVLRRVGSRR